MTTIDNYLALHANAIRLRSSRAEILAANLANADTPGYRARDMDFSAALNQANAAMTKHPHRTHKAHIPLGGSGATAQTYFLDSPQGSLDQNTVDSELERTKFADNDVRYQASIQFMSSKISGLIRAIRGE